MDSTIVWRFDHQGYPKEGHNVVRKSLLQIWYYIVFTLNLGKVKMILDAYNVIFR